jgi:hypothetical protein
VIQVTISGPAARAHGHRGAGRADAFRSAADALAQEERGPVKRLVGLIEDARERLEHVRHLRGDVEDDVDLGVGGAYREPAASSRSISFVPTCTSMGGRPVRSAATAGLSSGLRRS